MDILNIILNILTSGLPCCLLAIGIFLTYRLLDFADLSAEGSFLLAASITGVTIYLGWNPFLSTILGFFIGALCGLITGILNRLLKIPKLLSGIITLSACGSIALLIMGLSKNNEMFASQVPITIKKGGEIQTIYSIFYPWKAPRNKIVEAGVMFVIVATMISIIYYFFGTEYGMAIRATGMNEKMARAQGINTNVSTIICVSISNALIGLAGSLYVQDALTVSAVSATGYLVIGLASILIGEAIFGKRNFLNWLISAALGSIVYFTIITIAISLGFPTELKNLLYAFLIAFALTLPLFKKSIRKFFDKFKKRKGDEIC